MSNKQNSAANELIDRILDLHDRVKKQEEQTEKVSGCYASLALVAGFAVESFKKDEDLSVMSEKMEALAKAVKLYNAS